MDERKRRIGENEALFRHVNEKTQGLNASLSRLTQTFMVVCECGKIECLEQIAVTPEHYEQTRGDPTRFLVVPGHELPDTEEVVERREGYLVVQKDPGAPSALAEETDARS